MVLQHSKTDVAQLEFFTTYKLYICIQSNVHGIYIKEGCLYDFNFFKIFNCILGGD